MAVKCDKCGRSFKTSSGRSWHLKNSCPSGRKARPTGAPGSRRPSTTSWQKDVASDRILVVSPGSALGIKAPYIAYVMTFDGDVFADGHILVAQTVDIAKKKAEAAWKAGKFGKPGDSFWARDYEHRIGKGWYRAKS